MPSHGSRCIWSLFSGLAGDLDFFTQQVDDLHGDRRALLRRVELVGDLDGIARARKLSHATMSNIRQNLFWAFAYNAAGVLIAAGLLYPWTGWLLSPKIAAAAMSSSSVTVIGYALRLRKTEVSAKIRPSTLARSTADRRVLGS